MSIVQNAGAGEVSTGFYDHEISNSLRFDDGDSASLTRTPGSASNQRTWTWSSWVKRSTLGTIQTIFSGGTGSTLSVEFGFTSSDQIQMLDTNNTYLFITTAVFRDVSSWYHIVIENDTTQSTVNNRTKLYVNGTQITSFATDNRSNFAEDEDTGINSANVHYIGRWINGGQFFDGYLAEVNFVDGTALDPTSFGETKDGVWIPKNTSGLTFGTNGFRLEFKQTGTSQNASGIGADTSGETNHLSVTNLVASDIMPDSPTSNWTTLNPLTQGSSDLTTEGNLKCANFFDSDLSGRCATFYPDSGKWYWEVRVQGASTYPYIGITDQLLTNRYAGGAGWGSYLSIAWGPNGAAVSSGTGLGTITKENIPSYGNGNILGFALDAAARKLWVAEDNTWADSGDPANGTGENASWTLTRNVTPFISGYQAQGDNTHFNFGQDSTFSGAISAGGNADGNNIGDFAYEPPAGFLAMASPNFPELTIGPGETTQADDHFNTVLYTGNAGTQSITGVGFSPNWLWVKNRATTYSHALVDSVRGATLSLASDSTAVERTSDITSLDSDGFSLQFVTATGSYSENQGSQAYVAWNWKAGGSASTIAADSVSSGVPTIDSSVSANTTAGFSIVTYTGTGTAGNTVGHGLGVKPDAIIVKRRANAVSNWLVYHQGAASDPETDYLTLETSNALADNAGPWNDTAPTSSVFTIGATAWTNTSGGTYVAYCFAEVDGYSKFGKYQGRANANGMFVFTGFRPAWLMIKNLGASGSWIIFDNTREGGVSNIVNDHLMADTTAAEGTDSDIDILSNGFKNRRSSTSFNSAHEFVYFAFADQPFKFANAR